MIYQNFLLLLVSWSADEGHYQIYLDGSPNVEGFNLSLARPIAGNGIFIVGQEQDTIGGKVNFLDHHKYFVNFF